MNLKSFMIKLREDILARSCAHSTFFKDARDEIALNNLRTLEVSCWAALILLTVLLLIAPLIVFNWRVTWEYLALYPILGFFALFSTFYRKTHARPDPRVSTALCVCFSVALLVDLSAISIFPYPDAPQCYLTLILMVIPVLFNLRPALLSLLMISATIVYALVAFRFKDPIIARHDLFSAVAATLFSHVVMWVTGTLRANDYQTRTRYQRLSMMDHLTGIFNKLTFEQHCRTYLAARPDNEACALFVIDIDHFKEVNDTLGHRFGDELLELFGAGLRDIFRETDLIGRIGGDEFCVLMRRTGNAEHLRRKAQSMLGAAETASSQTLRQTVSCSIGVALSPAPFVSYESLFATADRALYAAKAQGRHRFIIETVASASEMTQSTNC